MSKSIPSSHLRILTDTGLTDPEARCVYTIDRYSDGRTGAPLTDKRVHLLAATYIFMNQDKTRPQESWYLIPGYIEDYKKSLPEDARMQSETLAAFTHTHFIPTISNVSLHALYHYARTMAEHNPTEEGDRKCIITLNGSELQITKRVNIVFCWLLRFIQLISMSEIRLYNYTYKPLDTSQDKTILYALAKDYNTYKDERDDTAITIGLYHSDIHSFYANAGFSKTDWETAVRETIYTP